MVVEVGRQVGVAEKGKGRMQIRDRLDVFLHCFNCIWPSAKQGCSVLETL